MLLTISLKRLSAGVRSWKWRFGLRSIILSASAYRLPSPSAARNWRLSMRKKLLFSLNISRRTPRLTGGGFLSVSLSHPLPKNRKGVDVTSLFPSRGRKEPRQGGFLDIGHAKKAQI